MDMERFDGQYLHILAIGRAIQVYHVGLPLFVKKIRLDLLLAASNS